MKYFTDSFSNKDKGMVIEIVSLELSYIKEIKFQPKKQIIFPVEYNDTVNYTIEFMLCGFWKDSVVELSMYPLDCNLTNVNNWYHIYMQKQFKTIAELIKSELTKKTKKNFTFYSNNYQQVIFSDILESYNRNKSKDIDYFEQSVRLPTDITNMIGIYFINTIINIIYNRYETYRYFILIKY